MANMTKEMKAFLKDLAKVLEKHSASIESSERFIPYEPTGHQVEFCVPGSYVEMDTSYVYPSEIREMIEKSG